MNYMVDALGEICPVPIIKAIEVYCKMLRSEVLVLSTDHSCVLTSIVDYFNHFQCKISVDEVINGVWEIKIEKLE